MILVFIFSAISLWITIDYKNNVSNQVKSVVKSSIDNLNLPNILDNIDKSVDNKVNSLNLKDGYTPVKGVDYFDGQSVKGDNGKDAITPIKGIDYNDGKDGSDGRDGKTPIKGEDYFDGKTPIMVCNTKKNRWEVTYNNGYSYDIVMSKDGLSTVKCVI